MKTATRIAWALAWSCFGCSAAVSVGDPAESVGSAEEALAAQTRWVDVHGHDGPAGAPNDCRSSHRPCATIQHAVDVAAARDTVRIGEGTYIENVVLPRAITLRGEGARTVLLPAQSAPRPCDDGALCGGAASTIVLVRASDVRIADLALDGDNPALTSGVAVGGADVDARNGIVTDYALGAFERFTVEDVRISSVFARGLEASGGTFSFRRVYIANVRGDDASIGILAFGAAGLVEGARVEDVSDGIALNHSLGSVVRASHVRRAASGIHSDNAGDGADAVADLIEDNTVVCPANDAYGIWSYVPYVGPLVRANDVHGCGVGLAVFGGSAALRTDGNAVVGGSIGALVSDYAGVQGALHAECDRIEKNEVGVQTSSAEVRVHDAVIAGNTTGIDASGVASGSVDARESYWGCAAGPGGAGCDSVVGNVDTSGALHHAPACGHDGHHGHHGHHEPGAAPR